MFARLLSLAVFAAAGAAPAAQAVTVTVNVTLDTAGIVEQTPGSGFFGVQGSPAFTPAVSFALAVGDTLNDTIDFLDAQTLTITGVDSLWGLIFSSSGGEQDSSSQGTLTLLSTSGAALWTSAMKTDLEGSVHVGQFFSSFEFPGLPADVTFGGLRYVGTVLSYTPRNPGVDPVITTRDYNQPAFYFGAQSYVTAIPEPASGASLLRGLALTGLWLQRRRRRMAAG